MNYVIDNIKLPVFYFATEPSEGVMVSIPYSLTANPITALHYHKSAELGVCLSGEGETRIGNKVYSFKKGCIQILPPRASHLSKANKGVVSNWVWIYINPQKVFNDLGLTDPDGVISLSADDNFLCGVYEENEYPELTRLVSEIIKEYNENEEDKKLRLAVAVSKFLLVCRQIKRKINLSRVATTNTPVNSQIQPVLDYISSNLDDSENLTEPNLAKLINVSVSTLRRFFKQHAKMNPKEFIVRSRIAYAEYLLRKTNLTVIDVSMRVGYNEISGFNRTFKRFYKLSPSKYRKLNK